MPHTHARIESCRDLSLLLEGQKSLRTGLVGVPFLSKGPVGLERRIGRMLLGLKCVPRPIRRICPRPVATEAVQFARSLAQLVESGILGEGAEVEGGGGGLRGRRSAWGGVGEIRAAYT